jgi:hypothetical protein
MPKGRNGKSQRKQNRAMTKGKGTGHSNINSSGGRRTHKPCDKIVRMKEMAVMVEGKFFKVDFSMKAYKGFLNGDMIINAIKFYPNCANPEEFKIILPVHQKELCLQVGDKVAEKCGIVRDSYSFVGATRYE